MGTTNLREALVIISFVSFSIMFAISVVGPLLNELAIEEGIPLGQNPNTTIGLIFALGGLSLAAFQVPFANLSDRLGRRKFVVPGCLVVGASILMMGYAGEIADPSITFLGWSHSALLLALFRVLQGAGAAATWPILMAAISSIFPKEKMGLAMGIFGASFGLGMSIGPVIGPAMVAWSGIHAPFILSAILAVLASIITIWLPPSQPSSRRRPKFVLDHKLMSLSLVAFTLLYVMGSIVVIYPRYMRSFLGLSIGSVAIAMASASLTYTFLQPVTGKLADRIDKRIMIILGLIIFSIASSILGFLDSPVEIYIATLIFGVSAAFVFPASNALLGIISPKGMEGTYSGFYNMMLSLGVTISPIVIGIFADTYGYGVAYLSILAPALVSLLYFMLVRNEFLARK